MWRLDRPRVIAILNVTPDSFSDGGTHVGVDAAVLAAKRFVSEGAVCIDVGGESTRPGAARVGAADQIDRVVPVIRALRSALPDSVALSVDTTLSQVGAAAIREGAECVNDVSGGTEDPEILDVCARSGAGLILMHRLVPPDRDVLSTEYRTAPAYEGGVVPAVCAALRDMLARAISAGVSPSSVVIDPGLGFGKSVEDNLCLIAGTPEVLKLGRPVLSATSRKSFVARAAGLSDRTPPRERALASVGLSVAHLHAGARVFRVHDVRMHVEALESAWSVMNVAQGTSR